MRKRSLLTLFGGAVLALTMTSLAWACITVRGQTSVKVLGQEADAECEGEYQCVSPGDRIVASAKGAIAGEEYWLHFRNYTRTGTFPHEAPRDQECGGGFAGRAVDDDVRISNKSSTSDIEGRIGKLKGLIPEGAQPSSSFGGTLGPALVCFVTEDSNIYTFSEALTVM